ncbi:unnamed protein product [Amoebophrya sp. A25]|nr:unnamed protein product [Amoebophrya sp. A25]|eukprot:GSA25T00002678001.1
MASSSSSSLLLTGSGPSSSSSSLKRGREPEVETETSLIDLAVPDEVPDEEEIMRLLEAGGDEHFEEFSVKKALAQLERKLKQNQDLRIRFGDDPAAFAESEVELNEGLLKLKDLAASGAEAFEEFLKLNGLSLLLRCMAHVNTDISICVLELLNALTETDNFELGDEDQVGGSSSSSSAPGPQMTPAERFVDAIVTAKVPEMVLDTMLRIGDAAGEEEIRGIQEAFGFIENIVEIKPDVVKVFAQMKNFLPWLLKRLRGDGAATRHYAAEILSIILQNDVSARGDFGVQNMGRLLKTVAGYRRDELTDNLEIEFAENVFDCLCQVLLVDTHQDGFLKEQGLDLMIRIMNRASYASKLALKVADMACRGHKENCNNFVEKLGLKPLFAFFMRKGLKKKDLIESEEYILGLMQSLTRYCTGDAQARLMNKFTENEFEKLQRLFEVHLEFSQRLRLADEQRAEGRELVKEDLQLEEEDIYLERCDDGLASLQLADLTIIRLANMGNRQVADAVQALFALKGVSKAEMREILEEYVAHLDPDLGAKDAKEIKRHTEEVLGKKG